MYNEREEWRLGKVNYMDMLGVNVPAWQRSNGKERMLSKQELKILNTGFVLWAHRRTENLLPPVWFFLYSVNQGFLFFFVIKDVCKMCTTPTLISLTNWNNPLGPQLGSLLKKIHTHGLISVPFERYRKKLWRSKELACRGNKGTMVWTFITCRCIHLSAGALKLF